MHGAGHCALIDGVKFAPYGGKSFVKRSRQPLTCFILSELSGLPAFLSGCAARASILNPLFAALLLKLCPALPHFEKEGFCKTATEDRYLQRRYREVSWCLQVADMPTFRPAHAPAHSQQFTSRASISMVNASSAQVA